MAPTLQEIIAKRNELGLSNNMEAKKALESTQTPVTPTTPAVPTPAPTQINQLPVDPNTGISKPLEQTPAPAPVQSQVIPGQQDPNETRQLPQVQAEVKPPEPVKQIASAKIEPVVDYTQAKGREQDIINNLNTFKAQNMTPEQIMKASGYAEATPEKKALIDPYLKVQTPTASAMYNAIATKADIPEEQKATLPFKIAQNRYTKANSYSTMTPSQLANEMNNSRFIQGSQAYEDVKAMNPKLVQDTENLRIVNGSKQNVFTYTNNPDGTTTKVNNLEKTFAEDYLDNFADEIKKMYAVQTPEQIRAIINTPDVVAAEDKAFDIEGKINAIDTLIEGSDKAIEESLAGTGASGQRIQLEKQAQREKLENEKDSLVKEYTRYANKANNLITQNTTLYTTQQQQKQQQNAAMLPFLQDQYKIEQAKQQAEAALNDPATAIKSVMDEYKKLGIPFTSTVQSRLAEFNASGKTLPQFLTDMGKNIQASPAYQKYEALQQGQMSDIQKMQATQAFQNQSDLRNFAQQKELAKYNNDLNRQEFLFKIENDPEQKAKTAALEAQLNANKSLFDVLGKNVGTYEGNRGYDLAGALGDPLPAGGNWTVKSVDTAGEQVGSIFIGGKGQKPYGNTVVMQDENGNEIRYSHLQNIGVKPGDVLGFGDIVGTRGNTGNVMGANGEKLTADQLKAGRGAHLDVEIKSGGKLLSNADQVNFLKGLKAGGSTGQTPLIQGIGREFVESGKMPTEYVMKSTGLTPNELITQGVSQYVAGKNAGLSKLGMQISDPTPYISADDEQRKNMGKAITAIPDLINKIDRWKTLVDKHGTEMESTNIGSEMKQLRTDVLTTLKSEAFLNLGVLQPVDLQFMEGLVPNSNTWVMPEWNQSENLLRLRDNFLNKMYTNGSVMGISKVGDGGIPSQPTTTTPVGGQTYQGYTIKGMD